MANAVALFQDPIPHTVTRVHLVHTTATLDQPPVMDAILDIIAQVK